ncbi:MAG: hypothetical protein OEW39_10090 [Deltaproteobacteria bacterium]|nr:hypothetical protein [Deltaproteobacteria bacterium]
MEMTIRPDSGNEGTLKLFSDLLVIYLLVGSAMGDCDLYRRMGRSLANNDPVRMKAAMDEFNELSRPLKERILKGDPHFKSPEPPLRRPEAIPATASRRQRAF